MASELHVDAIKHSGGTSALTIDSSGSVTIQQTDYFLARRTSGQILELIQFDTNFKSTHHYNNSNGKFTAK